MLERGLARGFSDAVEREARSATGGEYARRDLRALPTFTIDPASARDFDDALSAERLKDGQVRLWVHIADVAAYVPEDSLTDREARRRSTSVYVPGTVEPMLPGALSNEACSLVPNQDRFTVTVELDFDGPQIKRAAFHRAVIRSDERLDYDRVDRILSGTETASEPWAQPLALVRELAAELGRERARRGALEISSGEPEFGFDRHGGVATVRVATQSESHRLVEHAMIAANEAVAKLLQDRGTPTLYRVHEQPDPRRIERLIDQLASLDVPTPPMPEHLSPSAAGELVGEISQAVERHVRARGWGRAALNSLVLRSLEQAHYAPRNIGHAGLHSPCYCHFTSPIRRYPDIVCHRALLSAIGATDASPAAAAMSELAQWTSVREREAVDIERAADDIAHCFALAKYDREKDWDGEVSGLIGAGAFVTFGDGHEGMLPVRRMHGDWWELNEQGTILHGTRSGATLRLGDTVRVRVHGIDAPRGRVDLEFAPGDGARAG